MAINFIDKGDPAYDRAAMLVAGPSSIGKTSGVIRSIFGQKFEGIDEDGADVWSDPIAPPEGQKLFTVTTENGLGCVADLVKAGYVKGAEVSTLADLLEVLEFLSTNEKVMEDYSWILLDSITDMSDRIYAQALKDNPNGYGADTNHYNINLLKILRAFRDLKQYSVIMTCVTVVPPVPFGDDKKKTIMDPVFEVHGKKFDTDKIRSLFDEILFMERLGSESHSERRFVCKEGPGYPLPKDRLGKLKRHEPVDLLHIRKKLIGY